MLVAHLGRLYLTHGASAIYQLPLVTLHLRLTYLRVHRLVHHLHIYRQVHLLLSLLFLLLVVAQFSRFVRVCHI